MKATPDNPGDSHVFFEDLLGPSNAASAHVAGDFEKVLDSSLKAEDDASSASSGYVSEEAEHAW